MTQVVFHKVSLRDRRSGKCSRCGKRTTRTLKAWQTLNPLNKAADGLPKTLEQIFSELKQDILKWRESPLRCSRCEE
jgi:hypothetical protein